MKVILALGLAALLCACNAGAKNSAPGSATDAPSKPAFGNFGVDTTQMDTSVKPGDDFYRYVNGKWLDTFKIPQDKARYGMFDLLRDKAENDIRTLLEELAKTAPPAGSIKQKVLDFYNSWMNASAIESRGTEPLKVDLE